MIDPVEFRQAVRREMARREVLADPPRDDGPRVCSHSRE
jgi:hypothetical protein